MEIILKFCLAFLSLTYFVSSQSLRNVYDLNSMPSERNYILAKHNQLRATISASNMQEMVWDQGLANQAKAWAASCNANHSPSWTRKGSNGYDWIGENLWWWDSNSFPDLGRVVQDLFDEIRYYDYNSNSCSHVCGHYTQVVWAKTCAVGCAVSYCNSLINSFGIPRGHFVVCNYGPGGNYIGQQPYIAGSKCSNCPGGCVNGLCVSQCSGSKSNWGKVQAQPAPAPAPAPAPKPKPKPAPVIKPPPTTVLTKPVKTSGSNIKCEDLDWECASFARIGECNANPVWMSRNCPVSCNLCTKSRSGCVDNDWECSRFANLGECASNPVWMHRNCRLSCNLCSSSSTSRCTDDDWECSSFARRGECTINPTWMNRNCRKSCNLC